MSSPEQPAPDIRIVGGNPTPEDVAAVTAVLTAALDELSVESRRRNDARPTAWQASQRAVRRPRPFGTWRNFHA